MFGKAWLMAFDMKDYREVPERIAEWYQRHEFGRINCDIIERPEDGCDRWTVRASVYRSADPDEPPAGVGHSFLTVPGRTPYTRDSELENAETSAAGRALVMAGIPAKSVASEGEVRSKKSADVEPAATVTRSPESGGKAEAAGSEVPASGPKREDAEADGEAASASHDPTDAEMRKDFRAYLAETYGTAQALLMARELFQTKARSVKNMTVLSLAELQEIDTEFKDRQAAVSA